MQRHTVNGPMLHRVVPQDIQRIQVFSEKNIQVFPQQNSNRSIPQPPHQFLQRNRQLSSENIQLQSKPRNFSQTSDNVNLSRRFQQLENGDTPLSRNPSGLNSIKNSFGRMNKDQLREEIKKKNELVQDLKNNQKFIKEQCEQKLKEYLDKIKFDIKGKIYDKVVKSTLHSIYRHYENYLKRNPVEAERIMIQNLSKQQEQIQLLENQNQAQKEKNKQLKQ